MPRVSNLIKHPIGPPIFETGVPERLSDVVVAVVVPAGVKVILMLGNTIGPKDSAVVELVVEKDVIVVEERSIFSRTSEMLGVVVGTTNLSACAKSLSPSTIHVKNRPAPKNIKGNLQELGIKVLIGLIFT